MENNRCFLCDKEAEVRSVIDKDYYSVDCVTCGNYRIARETTEDVIPNMQDKHILSGISRSFSEKEIELSIDNKNYNDIIKNSFVPKDPIEMIDLLLLYISHNSMPLHQGFKIKKTDYTIVFARNFGEYRFIIETATDIGYLKKYDSTLCSLEIEGWKRVTQIGNAQIKSNKVFVAMWFNDLTEKLRTSIKSAINGAGYEAIIADESDYTGNIMDFVLGSIKQSKFVIADFTTAPEKKIDTGKKHIITGGIRGGVYYEAGFAKGYGLNVIHLCKDDEECKKRLHFDIAQENTIFWNDNETADIKVRKISERTPNYSPRNLSEKIYDRIVRIFGTGNCKFS